MKRFFKAFLSVSVCMTLILAAVPALAVNTPGKIDYVAFGDSVAAGVRGGVGVPGSELSSDKGYTDLIAGMLSNAGVLGSFDESFCTSGMTAKLLSEKTAVLLDPTSDASKLVRDAEIITLDIGANDLLSPLYTYAASIKNLADIDNAKVKAILTEMVKNLYGSTGQEIQSGIEKILNNILTANSSAKIYVMGYYNPLPVISALYDVDLNEPTKYLNALINKAIANVISAHTGASITYVETYDAIAASSTALVMMDIHPTEAGYRIIADEFWKQIEKLTVYYIADAVPSKHHIFVDGVQVPFSAYNVNGNNYVKLRDLSMAFNGTRGQVSISYDKATKAVNIIKGQAYTPVGGELIGIAGMTEAKAYLSAAEFNINGEIVNLTAYNINGNNYIKLRDLSEALNFSVEYDASTSTVSIELTKR